MIHLTMLTEKIWDKKNERENKMKINEVDKKNEMIKKDFLKKKKSGRECGRVGVKTICFIVISLYI